MSDGADGGRLLERVLGAAGLLLLLSMLGFFGYQALAVREGDADLKTSVVRVEHVGDEHVVHYEVRNEGGTTAEEVQVVGELRRNGEVVAEVTSTVDYVPVGSTRSGALVFDQDPRTATLQVRAAAYVEP